MSTRICDEGEFTAKWWNERTTMDGKKRPKILRKTEWGKWNRNPSREATTKVKEKEYCGHSYLFRSDQRRHGEIPNTHRLFPSCVRFAPSPKMVFFLFGECVCLCEWVSALFGNPPCAAVCPSGLAVRVSQLIATFNEMLVQWFFKWCKVLAKYARKILGNFIKMNILPTSSYRCGAQRTQCRTGILGSEIFTASLLLIATIVLIFYCPSCSLLSAFSSLRIIFTITSLVFFAFLFLLVSTRFLWLLLNFLLFTSVGFAVETT